MKFCRPFSLGELLSLVGYNNDFNGDADSAVYGFSDDFFAQKGDITWTENVHVLKRLLSLEHSLTIITNHPVDRKFVNKNVICCANPLRLFETIVDSAYFTSTKENKIGKNTFIHDTVCIGNNVKIGDNCSLSPNVVIGDNVIVGNNVTIEPFTIIGNTPYYTLWDQNKRLRNRKIYGNVIIKDNVSIGSFCSIDNGITCETIIGSGSKLGNYVEIGHDVKVGNNCCFAAQTAIAGYVSIGNDCVFWAKSGVSNRIQIAPHTTLLASSILTKSVSASGLTLCGFPAIDRIKYWKKYSHKHNE